MPFKCHCNNPWLVESMLKCFIVLPITMFHDLTLLPKHLHCLPKNPKKLPCCLKCLPRIMGNWRTPKLLDGFNYEPKGEDIGRRKSWGVLLGSQHFKGRGVCWSSEMGLRKLISNSLTHINLHKPNNKLVSA